MLSALTGGKKSSGPDPELQRLQKESLQREKDRSGKITAGEKARKNVTGRQGRNLLAFSSGFTGVTNPKLSGPSQTAVN